jgi:hypothetical protein
LRLRAQFFQPFLRLLMTVAAGTAIFCARFDLEQSLGLSLVNTLGIFGFRRDFVAPWVPAISCRS